VSRYRDWVRPVSDIVEAGDVVAEATLQTGDAEVVDDREIGLRERCLARARLGVRDQHQDVGVGVVARCGRAFSGYCLNVYSGSCHVGLLDDSPDSAASGRSVTAGSRFATIL
jgi:hypothetical protein